MVDDVNFERKGKKEKREKWLAIVSKLGLLSALLVPKDQVNPVVEVLRNVVGLQGYTSKEDFGQSKTNEAKEKKKHSRSQTLSVNLDELFRGLGPWRQDHVANFVIVNGAKVIVVCIVHKLGQIIELWDQFLRARSILFFCYYWRLFAYFRVSCFAQQTFRSDVLFRQFSQACGIEKKVLPGWSNLPL